MTRILIATDGSKHSEAAVDEVCRLRLGESCEIWILSVIEPSYTPTTYTGGGVDTQIYGSLEGASKERAAAAVDKAAAKLRAHEHSPLTITTKVRSGSPKKIILEEAEAVGADLIVMGSHGHGVIERFLLGSVSQAAALHAECSVEIVRNPIRRGEGE